MKFLEFTFTSFWHFIGVCILFGGALDGIAAILRAWRKP